MIYLDNGATSFVKPGAVSRAVIRAMQTCANPGRGGHRAAQEAAISDMPRMPEQKLSLPGKPSTVRSWKRVSASCP